MPQEHGLRGETEWAELSGKSFLSLKNQGETPFAFSASHHDPEQLTRAFHTCDLGARPETFFCVDAKHRGLGSGSCGPDTLPQYRLNSSHYELRLQLSFEPSMKAAGPSFG